MNNRQDGEVGFEADGKQYVMRYSIDAICRLEEVAGKGIVAISKELLDPDKMKMSTVRMVFWAGLVEHHPGITLREAGDLIPKAGGMNGVKTMLTAAFGASFPDEVEVEGDRPQQAGQVNGTGSPSTPSGSEAAGPRESSGRQLQDK